jgi:hypothetical protein
VEKGGLILALMRGIIGLKCLDEVKYCGGGSAKAQKN